jgi:hypothetical protein
VPGPTSSWKGGKPASELTDKDKGTAVATFINLKPEQIQEAKGNKSTKQITTDQITVDTGGKVPQ